MDRYRNRGPRRRRRNGPDSGVGRIVLPGRHRYGKTWVRGLRELRSLGYDVLMLTSNPDDDMSAYYALDLKSIAVKHGVPGDVYNEPAKLLKVCLYARDEYNDLADEIPPYNALVAAAEHAGLRFKNPE